MANWFNQQGPSGINPGAAGTGAAGIMAPKQTPEDQRLLQDPAFRQAYSAWVNAQGPGAADWATPTKFQQVQAGIPLDQQGTTPAGAPPLQPGGAAPATGNPTDRNYIRSQLANWYASQGLQPGGRGSGATDIDYYTDGILKTGGWTDATARGENNIGYWTNRIGGDLRGGGAGGGGGAAGGSGFGMLSGGTGSLAGLAAGALETSPGFQFRLGEGMKALERSAASKGTLLTGGTLKGLTRYAQDYASNEYGQNYNRLFNEQGARYQQLFGLSNLGLTAAGQQAGTGSAYTGQLGNLTSNQANQGTNLITDAGNVNARSTIEQNNAANQGRSSITDNAYNAYLYWLKYGQGGGNNLPGEHLPNPTVP